MKISGFLIVLSFFISSCSNFGQDSDLTHPNKENLLPEESIDNYINQNTNTALIDSNSLVLLNSIGTNEGSIEEMLGRIIVSKIIDTSQVVVLDNSQNRLKVFDFQTGKLQASLAREGRGPGELVQPTDMEVTGSNIIVSDRLLKLSFYSINNDSITFRDQVNIAYTPNKICAIDNFVFVSGIDLKSNYTIYKYDISTLEYLGQFHETYKSDNPLVSMMLSNNLISCNSATESILVVTPYLPYVYSYDTDGNLKWISEIEDFYPMIATEGIGSNGRSSLNQSLNTDGLTDRHLRFLEQNGSNFNVLQIIRTEMKNKETIGGSFLTFEIDTRTGEGSLISNEINKIYDLTNDYLILPGSEDYPTINLLQNPFDEL